MDEKLFPKIEIIGDTLKTPLLTIVVGVHGDELAPIKAIEKLKVYLKDKHINKSFKIIYANTLAIRENRRFIDRDLNGCFLHQTENTYEEILAKFLKEEIGKTLYCFDFHSTSFHISHAYGIISKYSDHLKEILSEIGINDNVFVDKESLIKYSNYGIGFEVGREGDENSILTAFNIMKNILEFFNIIEKVNEIELKEKKDVSLFLIYKVIPKEGIEKVENIISDFKKIIKGDKIADMNNGEVLYAKEDFYPIWINDSLYIRMAKKIHIEE